MAERHVHVVAGIMRSTKFCPGYTPVLSDIVKQLLVCKWINITKRKIGKPVSYQNLVVIHAMVPESCEKEYKTAMVKMFRNSILSVMDYQDEEAKQSYERSIYEKLTKHTSLLNTLRHGADVTAGRYNYFTQTLPATHVMCLTLCFSIAIYLLYVYVFHHIKLFLYIINNVKINL